MIYLKIQTKFRKLKNLKIQFTFDFDLLVKPGGKFRTLPGIMDVDICENVSRLKPVDCFLQKAPY